MANRLCQKATMAGARPDHASSAAAPLIVLQWVVFFTVPIDPAIVAARMLSTAVLRPNFLITEDKISQFRCRNSSRRYQSFKQ
jgi:hypothetical protein